MPTLKRSRILGIAAVLALLASTAAPAQASPTPQPDAQKASFSFGVIGDVPYGSAQFARFPQMVTELNA